MKRLISILLSIITLTMLMGCNLGDRVNIDENTPYFTGKVIEIEEDRCLLQITDEGNQYLAKDSTVYVNTSIKDCPDFEVGDHLTVTFSGAVGLSLPPIVFSVLKIQKTTADGQFVKN